MDSAESEKYLLSSQVSAKAKHGKMASRVKFLEICRLIIARKVARIKFSNYFGQHDPTFIANWGQASRYLP
jgi:hypothetical protein